MSQPSPADDLSLESLMAQLADEFLERLDRGEQPTVEEYVQRHPRVATFIRQMFPTLMVMRGIDAHPETTLEVESQVTPAGQLGEFRILRQVGRGGMGIVYEAVQETLGRRVALKVLPFAAALDARLLQRFKTEAQAAAQLHHGNIVPVHSVGCERGVHYYAMQFIDGWSMSSVIDQLRQQRDVPGREGGADQRRGDSTPARGAISTLPAVGSSGYFLTVARWGEQIAEALDFAHSQGIVHRDVKPANLMLDGQGRPWVMDFGLAQVRSEIRLTMTGDVLGTLRYASPEQALGRREQVDHRSDTYSLGVTLYELLTLQPAYGGDDRESVLRRIAFEEPPSARALNRGVPDELDVIVAKAMAKEPADRYSTAAELAADLRRFREQQPIHARRPTLWQRGRKWATRNRTPLLAAAATAVLAQTITLGVLLYKNAEIREQKGAVEAALGREREAAQKARDEEAKAREEEEKARQEGEKARLALQREHKALEGEKGARAEAEKEGERARKAHARAEKNYLKARDVVDRLVFNVAENARGEPYLTPFARDLCRQALVEYRALLEDTPDDPVGEFRLANSYCRMGTLHRMLGETDEAVEALEKSIGMLEALAPKAKKSAGIVSVRGMAHEELSGIYYRRQDKQALTEAKKAIRCQKQALEEDEGNADYRRRLAGACAVCVHAQAWLNDAEGARENAEAAVKLYRDLAAEAETDADAQLNLGRGLVTLGTLQLTSKEAGEAEKTFREALKAVQKAAAIKVSGLLLATRTTAAVQLGRSLEEQKKFGDAEKAYRAALPDAQDSARLYPDSPLHVTRLSGTSWRLGALLVRGEKAAEGQRHLEQAVATQRQAADRDSKNVGYRQLLFLMLNDLAAAQLAQGNHPQAARTARDLADVAAKPPVTGTNLEPVILYSAGQTYCRCAAAVRGDQQIEEAKRTKLAEEHEAEAVAALRLGLKKGLRTARPLDKDVSLKPLWGREDFKELLKKQ